jgi:hypothetical protein
LAYRVALSGFSAFLIASLGPWVLYAWQIPRTSKGSVGIDILSFMPWRHLASPLFLIVTLCFFILFFAASRVGNKTLRVVIFWAPTILISATGVGVFSLVLSLSLYFRHR